MTRPRVLLVFAVALAAFHSVYFRLHQKLQRGSASASYSRHTPRDHNDARLRVATWNLRVPFPPDAERHLSWAERKYSIASATARLRPHLLAVQEDCYFMDDQLMDLDVGGGTRLSDTYTRYGLFNRNGEATPTEDWPENAFSAVVGRDGEHNSIWYEKERFLATKHVTFWLSRTPHVAGSSFDEVTGRVVNCVLLRERRYVAPTQRHRGASVGRTSVGGTSGCMKKEIFYCSAHLPSGNVTRQLWSVSVFSDMFSQYSQSFASDGLAEAPMMMVAGDFNAEPGSDTYDAMQKAGFVDSRRLSREETTTEEYTNTTNDWYGSPDAVIDYLWLYVGGHSERRNSRPSYDVVSVKHIPVPCCASSTLDGSDGSLNMTASDHLMVLVDFDLLN